MNALSLRWFSLLHSEMHRNWIQFSPELIQIRIQEDWYKYDWLWCFMFCILCLFLALCVLYFVFFVFSVEDLMFCIYCALCRFICDLFLPCALCFVYCFSLIHILGEKEISRLIVDMWSNRKWGDLRARIYRNRCWRLWLVNNSNLRK